MKFNDSSRALRFWYEKDKRFKIFRGMFIKEYDIGLLKKEIDRNVCYQDALKEVC